MPVLLIIPFQDGDDIQQGGRQLTMPFASFQVVRLEKPIVNAEGSEQHPTLQVGMVKSTDGTLMTEFPAWFDESVNCYLLDISWMRKFLPCTNRHAEFSIHANTPLMRR